MRAGGSGKIMIVVVQERGGQKKIDKSKYAARLIC